MKIMKKILFLMLILMVVFVGAGEYNFPLTRSVADKIYCMQNGECNLSTLTTINETVINFFSNGTATFQNVSMGGRGLNDTYCKLDGSNCQSLYWRLDGTNAPPTANWNMGGYYINSAGGMDFTDAIQPGSCGEVACTTFVGIEENPITHIYTSTLHFTNLLFMGAATEGFWYTLGDGSVSTHHNIDTYDLRLVDFYNGTQINDTIYRNVYNGSLQPASEYIANNTAGTLNLTLINATNASIGDLKAKTAVFSSPCSVSSGCTGASSFAVRGIIISSAIGTTSPLGVLAASATAGTFIRSSGGATPVAGYSALALPNAIAQDGMLYGSGANVVSATTAIKFDGTSNFNVSAASPSICLDDTTVGQGGFCMKASSGDLSFYDDTSGANFMVFDIGAKEITVSKLIDSSAGILATTANFTQSTGVGLNTVGNFSAKDGYIREDMDVARNFRVFGNFSAKRASATFSSNATQVMASPGTAYPILLNTSVDAYQIGISSDNSNLTFESPGKYAFIVSAIFKVTSANKKVELWYQENGVNVPNSNTVMTLPTAATEIPLAVPFHITVHSGDKISMQMATDDGGASMVGVPPTSYSPASPSIIVLIYRESDIT